MRVTHIAYSEAPGGAAKAAYRLHQNLRRLNISSSMLVHTKNTDDPTVSQYIAPIDKRNSVKRSLRKLYLRLSYMPYKRSRPKKYADPFNSDVTPYLGSTLIDQIPQADVLNLHWVSRFLDYTSFFSNVKLPVVWTLHDMAAFTGGCHYNDTCDKYLDHCRACPQLGSKRDRDIAYKSFERKQKIFSQLAADQLHIVALSKWMAAEVKNSPLLSKFPVTIIPNSLDISVYKPRDREEIRDILGIEQDTLVILCSAQLNTNFRKGYNILVAALSEALIPKKLLEKVLVISIGHGNIAFSSEIRHLNLGYMNQDGLISAIYNAADVFLLPSLQDNLPNTMLEAMACGTPVMGFKTGGIPDAVIDQETGVIIPSKNAEALAEGLKDLISNPEWLMEARKACRERAKKEYAPEIQAKRYASLYQSV